MFKFVTLELIMSSRTIKWSGFALPPLLPWPSQYNCPFPLITCPAAPVMVRPVPLMVMGSKSEFAVRANEVVPANVTVVPALSLLRSRATLVANEMPFKTMLVQEATAAATPPALHAN